MSLGFWQTIKRNFTVEKCRLLKHNLETNPDVFSRVITGDESSCNGYDPETKQQSSGRHHRHLQQKLDVEGAVHSEFVPSGQNVNKTFYLEVFKKNTQQSLSKKFPIWGRQETFQQCICIHAHSHLCKKVSMEDGKD